MRIGHGRILNFDEIENDIIYAVDAGSTVEDKMGSEFDLVPDTFNLTVGGTALTCTRNGNTYSFGDDTDPERFVVEYDETNDSFLWMIKENVSKFVPVQLTYNVKLTNPATAAGTYMVPTNLRYVYTRRYTVPQKRSGTPSLSFWRKYILEIKGGNLLWHAFRIVTDNILNATCGFMDNLL